uniref:uncharacterized protein LOC120331923 n=1 Tax=Styela clava TaxID=7725 RepID=UPI001939AEEA|nr:uncharacterized protein LOC120331923 [Styela clava]
MKVICAGMSKCGTKSVNAALRELGYVVYDFMENYDFYNAEYQRFVSDDWTVDDFRKMYNDVDVVIDGPFYYFWEEALESFPEAKVILMMRDADDIWYESISRQIHRNLKHHFYYNYLSSTWRRFWRFAFNAGLLPFGVHYTGYNTIEESIDAGLAMKQCYRRHIAHVVHSCPKDRLLIFNCKEGWKPLCDFLEKPIPRIPFPVINVKSELTEVIWKSAVLKRSTKEVYVSVGITIIALCSAAYVLGRFNKFI